MKKLHYISGSALSIFIFAHLINHFYSIFGACAHIELMNTLRLVYRNIIIESILMTAVFLQIISGISLVVYGKEKSYSSFKRLHIWSGLYLAFFLLAHVSAVLVGRFVLELDTNFYFGVAGLNTFPFNLFFVPYYGLAIFSFFAHLASIHAIKMKTAVSGLNPNEQSYLILIGGIFLTLFILYALTYRFDGVAIPEAYHILIGK